MKLFELVASSSIIPTNVRYTEFVDNMLSAHVKLGSGQYAHVFEANNPNAVTKIAKLAQKRYPDPLKDPYLTYIRYCMKMKHNPFLPKIYSVSVYNYTGEVPMNKRDEPYYAVVSLERLLPYNELPEDKAEIIIDGGFLQHWNQYAYGVDDDVIKTGDYSDAHARVLQHTKNVLLSQALQIVENLNQKRYGWPDFHDGNIMWRQQGSTYQLVITDPLY